jgi:hypothetical protein
MTAVSASLVKELREQTGAGMMDCKRVLVETGGDIEAAKKLLRERGMAQVAKRAGRETREGKVGSRVEGTKGVLVGVGARPNRCRTTTTSWRSPRGCSKPSGPTRRCRAGARRERQELRHGSARTSSSSSRPGSRPSTEA